MHPDNFESVLRIDTAEGVNTCVCICTVQKMNIPTIYLVDGYIET